MSEEYNTSGSPMISLTKADWDEMQLRLQQLEGRKNMSEPILTNLVDTAVETVVNLPETANGVLKKIDGADGSVPNGKIELSELKHFWNTPTGKKLAFNFIAVEATILTVLVQMYFQGLTNNPIFYALVVFFVSQFKTLFESIAELDNQNVILQNVQLTKLLNEANAALKIEQNKK